jgi:mono/diheme cytochrome c family protein
MLESSTVRTGLSKAEFSGRRVFTKYCQVCHGGAGDGKGFNAFNMQSSFGVQPADFTDSTFVAGLRDEVIVLAISKGGKAVGKSRYMPPWGNTLTDEEVQTVAAFIKTFSRAKVQTGVLE